MSTSPSTIRTTLLPPRLLLQHNAANELASYSNKHFSNQSATRLRSSDLAGNSKGAAQQLGNLASGQTYRFKDGVGKVDRRDFYTFTLDTRSNFRINLFGLGSKNFNIFGTSGANIFREKDAQRPNAQRAVEYSRILNSGTYYIRVNQSSGQANYRLRFESVNLAGDIENKELSSRQVTRALYYENGVNLYRYNQQGRTNQGIDPNQKTVVVIHGRGDSSEGSQIKALSRAVAERYEAQNYQVLALDWSKPADDAALVPLTAARSITPVAEWTTKTLNDLGIAKNQVTLMGHSLGAYVGAEVGRLYGKVKNLVALDPAFPAEQYDLNGNEPNDQKAGNFEDFAQRSLALVVQDGSPSGDSIAGDNDKASTAEDSLLVRYNGFFGLGPTKAHTTVVDVFRDALSKQHLKLENSLALPTHLYNFYNNSGGLVNRGSRHEGRILATRNGQVEKLIYVDRIASEKPQQNEAWN